MAPRYTVQAEVVDIRADRPRATDVFLVDTNVWFWMTYAVASQGAQGPAAPPPAVYSTYFKRALAAKAKFLRCGLSMAELAHLIENAEYQLFCATSPNVTAKQYRHNFPAERSRIANDIQAAWAAVRQIAAPLDVAIDDPTTDSALSRLSTQQLDGYDLFMVQAMVAAGVMQILTDDGDYCTVPGIQVFTANRHAIDAARAQGKLVTR
jgi:predicted nucleic acid-binding protein